MRNSERANSDKLLGGDDAITWLSKLTWEIAQIYEHPNDNVSVRIYRSMNCAITAWHMVDWIYELSNDAQKEELIRITEAHKHKGKFDVAIQEWCPEIGLCRQIATAAKHLDVKFHNREDVGLSGEYDDEKTEHAATLYISDKGTKHLDTDVYQEALAAWSALYVRLGMPWAQEVIKAVSPSVVGTLPKYPTINITIETLEEP